MERFYTDAIYGKVDAGFNASEAVEDYLQPLDDLCQLMFDPENQPPQLTREQAWTRYMEIRTLAKDHAQIYVDSLKTSQEGQPK